MTSQPFSQHARLIRIETAQGSGLPESLVAESFTGFEAVNALFHFEIDALSLSTDVDLKLFIGEQITLRLLLADDSLRAWHGYCTEAAWLGADGGLARYRLRLEPFLAFLTLRRDARIFQDQDLRGILTTVLKDYPQANFAWDVTQTLAQRDICCQYRESDFDFLVRLLASEGLNWRFEHDQTPDAGGEDQGHARHKLILFDAQAPLPAMPGNPVLRFHGVRASEADDSIQHFSASRQVQSNTVAISSWDPYQLVAPAAETASALDVGDTPQLAVYDGSLERRFADPAVAGRHAELRLKALELGNKAFEGRSAVRQLNPGHGFELSQHERYAEDNQFTVVSVSHQATNNLDAGMA
ncbi:MAG: type VI secretion system tip protein VgrG, partial [Methylomonas sp.]